MVKEKYFTMRIDQEDFDRIKEKAIKERRTVSNYLVYYAMKEENNVS